jgi:tetratricopeptide (TPR) repeat protein
VVGEQANAQAWLADTYLENGQHEQSLAARRRQLALRAQLQQTDPSNMQRLYDLANAEQAVGRNESILHHRAAATPYFENAYARAIALVRHDSRNQTWLLFKARIECEWLLGEPGRSPSLTPARLRQNIAAAAAALAANPRIQEISPCLAPVRPGQLRTH